MISDKQIVELRLQQSLLARNIGEQEQKYLEGLRLIEKAEPTAKTSKYFQNAIIYTLEGLGWIWVSDILATNASLLAIERAKSLLLYICKKKPKFCRLSDEQKYVYLEIAKHFFSSKDLEEITELINRADNVVGWVNPA